MNSTETVLTELLELLSFAIVNLDEARHSGRVKLILDRLEQLAQREGPKAHFILLRVLSHRCMISCDAERFDEAIGFCHRGMTVAGPEHPEYYTFAVGLGRTYFEKHDIQKGYEALGEAIHRGIEHNMDKRLVLELLHIGTFSDARLSPEVFVAGARRYAMTYAGLTETQFRALWTQDAPYALNWLLEREATAEQSPEVTDEGTG